MSFHKSLMNQMKQMKMEMEKNGVTLNLPPNSMVELGIEYTDLVPGQRIVGKARFQERFTNPIGTFQGGILAALFDDHFGPLSYITAQRPCSTLSLNTTFVKPFSKNLEHVVIEAIVVKKTKSLIFMTGTVKTDVGDLLAHAESHVLIL